MKMKTILLTLLMLAVIFSGCAKEPEKPAPAPAPPQANPPATTPDVVTSASIVDKEAAFEKAISADNGTWIIATLKDLSFNKELVLDGEYKNGKKDDKGNDIIQRKIALYTQDDKRNVTARFTLTAPKLTIKSPMASIQHGTFKGDLYVVASNFKLVDTTVEGNVYFASDEAKSTFTMDDKSKVTGKQEVKK